MSYNLIFQLLLPTITIKVINYLDIPSTAAGTQFQGEFHQDQLSMFV